MPILHIMGPHSYLESKAIFAAYSIRFSKKKTFNGHPVRKKLEGVAVWYINCTATLRADPSNPMSKTVIRDPVVKNAGMLVNAELVTSTKWEYESLYVTLLLPGSDLKEHDCQTLVTKHKKEIIALSLPGCHSQFTASDYEKADDARMTIHGLSPQVAGDPADHIQILMSWVDYNASD